MISALLMAAALAGAPETAPASPAAPAPAKKSDIVCHMETVVGSLLPRKVCRSAAAQAANGRMDRQTIEQIQRFTFQCSPSGVKC